jgi:REP element-mobilizing transposase RayT
MPDKFKDKYRISSSRLNGWDYGSSGAYFVTVNTRKHVHFFGYIENDKMILNDLGKGVENLWLKTKEFRPDMNLELDEFVVMPNHFHGIITIGKNEFNDQKKKSLFGPQTKNLGSIMRGIKSSVTIFAKKSGIADFEWQPRYHDHIIRNEKEFQKIQSYIINNPSNWTKDKYFSE